MVRGSSAFDEHEKEWRLGALGSLSFKREHLPEFFFIQHFAFCPRALCLGACTEC
jgi:hypothetical protein